MGKDKPVKQVRLGRIRAAIWKNKTDNGEPWLNVTVKRLYKEGSNWKDAQTFRRDDLPIVCKALDLAYEWIWEQRMADEAEEVTTE